MNEIVKTYDHGEYRLRIWINNPQKVDHRHKVFDNLLADASEIFGKGGDNFYQIAESILKEVIYVNAVEILYCDDGVMVRRPNV